MVQNWERSMSRLYIVTQLIELLWGVHPGASQVALVLKNAIAGDIKDTGLIHGSRRSPGGRHGLPLQYSCLEKSMGQRNLVGYSPWDCRFGHDCSVLAHRVHHRKCSVGWPTSWNQDCWGKYQQPQICRWYHPNGRKQRGTKESLDEDETGVKKLA